MKRAAHVKQISMSPRSDGFAEGAGGNVLNVSGVGNDQQAAGVVPNPTALV